jgi:hypothetical protein
MRLTGAHLYAPQCLRDFLQEVAGRYAKLGKARSSHTAHMTIPSDVAIEYMRKVAARYGLTVEPVRCFHGGRLQIIVRAPTPTWEGK